jgi:two-component system, LytTR family, response regulator
VNESVLIADDEPLARRTLREHLLSLGWSGPIHEAHDGITAIRIANQQRPDLVFLDIVMPGVTGLERVIRRAQAELNGAGGSLLSRAKESLERTSSLSKIFVRDGNRIVPIPLASLERVQGTDDYVTICTAGKNYLVSLRLSDLESRLEAANFLRIHRSHLINLEYVTSIEPYDSARVQVVLRSGARIVASRTGSKRLRDLAL